MVEMVIPMEDLADPIPIDFTFKCTNTDDIILYVESEVVGPPAGWNGVPEEHGALGVGVDDYFVNDSYTRDTPANLTEDNITFRINYYSDAGYSVLVGSEDISYTITYVDFDDVGFTIVDDDTFEVDLEGWTKTDEVGATNLQRSTMRSRTGVASMQHWALDAGEVAYLTKSFTIGAVTRAFIRIWFMYECLANRETILEVITDAGGGSERVLRIAIDSNALGGDFTDQWVCFGLKVPVNGTYEVRLRMRIELGVPDYCVYDDIRVVQS